MRTLRSLTLPSHEILRLRSRMTTWDGASRIKVTIGTGRRDVDPYKFEKHRALIFGKATIYVAGGETPPLQGLTCISIKLVMFAQTNSKVSSIKERDQSRFPAGKSA